MVIVSSKWRDRKINVSPLFTKPNIFFSLFFSLILFFESSLDIYTEFGQNIPSGNAFSELGSIGTPPLDH